MGLVVEVSRTLGVIGYMSLEIGDMMGSIRGVQKYPDPKTRSEKLAFRFLKLGKLPGFPNSDILGWVPGFKTEYSDRIRIANFGKSGTRYPIYI